MVDDVAAEPGRDETVPTEGRRAADERRRRQDRMESLAQVAGAVGHSFNNLLTIILGNAELIAMLSEDDGPVASHAAAIIGAAERAARLTNQLQAFAGRQPGRAEPLDLNAVIGDLRPDLTVGDGAELVLDLMSGPAAISGGRKDVEQVVLNLVANASDATAAGGTVTITTASVCLDERDVLEHAEIEPGRFVRLSVTDTGVGMSAEIAARAFEPFVTTKPSGQPGLGLATVDGIMSELSGAASLWSEPGVGTTVHVFFPAADADAEHGGVALR